MKPLVVHSDWSKAYGGQEIRILTELREMRKLGYRVALIVPADSELANRAAAEGIDVYPVPFRSKFDLSSWRELVHVIRKLSPSVVNTHSSEDSWMAGCVARLCRVPLIVRTRHVLAPISSSLSYNLFPHVILTCSASIAEQLKSQGVRPDKLVVQPTGIDERRFCFAPDARQRIRQQYGIADREILVGNVGFLRHYKGHPFIIKTAAAMPDRFRFMIVGGGGELESLQSLAENLGVGERIIFAGHQEEPAPYFSAFDICFFSSYEAEGVSQSLIQALLNGLPVLACRIPSTMEPLQLSDTSRLVDYDDVATAKACLEELEAVRSMSPELSAPRSAIAARYGLQAMVANLVDTYARHGITC